MRVLTTFRSVISMTAIGLRLAIILPALLAMLEFAQAAQAQQSFAAKQPFKPATILRSVRWHPFDAGVRIVVDTDGAAQLQDFVLTDPWRIVIDFTGVRNGFDNKTIEVGVASIDRLRIGQPSPNAVRIVLDARSKVSYRVVRNGASVVVLVGTLHLNDAELAAARTAETRVAGQRIESQQHASRASTDELKNDREDAEQMRSRIEGLEARIRALEAERAETTRPRTVATAPAATTDTTTADASRAPDHTHQPNHRLPNGTPRLQIQGYADLNFRASDERGKKNAFALGQLDLFITSRLSEEFSVLGELIFQAGEDNAFTTEIHRLLLRYWPNDYINLSIGRYHTAIGYYNNAYHHGAWFQTAADRPFIFAFENQGGILPLHNVGLTATGRIPSGSLGLRYIAEIGNGRTSRSYLDRSFRDRAVQTAVDENNAKAVNFGVLARPHAVPGLQAGFSIYRDRLTPDELPKIGQIILAAHLVYQNVDYELSNEALVIRNALDGTGKVFNTPAFYSQVSRRFGDARPYFRYQYVNAPHDDPIFLDVGRRNGPSLGLRYDFTEFAAFKLQYNRTARRRLNSLNELLSQFAFTF